MPTIDKPGGYEIGGVGLLPVGRAIGRTSRPSGGRITNTDVNV